MRVLAEMMPSKLGESHAQHIRSWSERKCMRVGDADFPLPQLKKGAKDKLGNTVREVLFSEASYAIYWSDKGIFIHFSDSPEERRDQRQRFTEIVPELRELRYVSQANGHRDESWTAVMSRHRRGGRGAPGRIEEASRPFMMARDGITIRRSLFYVERRKKRSVLALSAKRQPDLEMPERRHANFNHITDGTDG